MGGGRGNPRGGGWWPEEEDCGFESRIGHLTCPDRAGPGRAAADFAFSLYKR